MRERESFESNDMLKTRTKKLALRVMRLVRSLPKDSVGRNVGNQLLRSATSVGANYRAACRARSRAEFCSKLGIVEEEADESNYWMELIVEDGMLPARRVSALLAEGEEILSMTVSSINTARRRGGAKRR